MISFRGLLKPLASTLLCLVVWTANAQLTYVKKNGKTYLQPEHPLTSLQLEGMQPDQLLQVDSTGVNVVGVAPSTPSMTNAATNCTIDAGGFKTCMLNNFTYNSSTGLGPGGDGQVLNLNIFGSGYNLGNAGGWTGNHLHSEVITSNVRGITGSNYQTLNCRRAGDCTGYYTYINSDMGILALSDESNVGYGLLLAENQGYFHGSIASSLGVGFLNVDPTFVSGNPWTTDEAFFINTTRDVITTSNTGPSVPLAGTILNYLPISSSLPITTTWGIASNANGSDVVPNPGVVAASSKAISVSMTVHAVGANYTPFPSSGVVCVVGNQYIEQATIASAGVMNSTTHVQQVQLNLRNPNKIITAFFGGPCGRYFNFTVDFASTGMRQLFPVIGSLTGSDMIYANQYLGGVKGHTLPSGSLATRTGPNAITIFHGAEVVGNRSSGPNPILEPNTMDLEQGDLVEVPHPANVGVKARSTTVALSTPCVPGQDCEVDQMWYQGTGITGSFTAQTVHNLNPSSYYFAGGGRNTAPTYTSIKGAHSALWSVEETPQEQYPGKAGWVFRFFNPGGSGSGANPNPPVQDWDFLLVDPHGPNSNGTRIRFHPATGYIEIPLLQSSILKAGNGFTGDCPAGAVIHVAAGIITGCN